MNNAFFKDINVQQDFDDKLSRIGGNKYYERADILKTLNKNKI